MNLFVVFGLGYGVEFIYKQLMSLLLLGVFMWYRLQQSL